MQVVRRTVVVLLLLVMPAVRTFADVPPKWLQEFTGGLVGEIVVAGVLRALGADGGAVFPIGTAIGTTGGIIVAGELCGDGARGSKADAFLGTVIGQFLGYVVGVGVVIGTGFTSEKGRLVGTGVMLIAGPMAGTLGYRRYMAVGKQSRMRPSLKLGNTGRQNPMGGLAGSHVGIVQAPSARQKPCVWCYHSVDHALCSLLTLPRTPTGDVASSDFLNARSFLGIPRPSGRFGARTACKGKVQKGGPSNRNPAQGLR